MRSLLRTSGSFLFALHLFCVSNGFAPAQEAAPVSTTSRATFVEHTRAAATALTALYDRDTGLFRTTGWWNSANAVTALANATRVTGDQSFQWIFPATFEHAPKRHAGFLNEFYDDEGWWALAWIDVYELAPKAPGAKQYLHTSQAIFEDMAGGWNDTCGGGIWWKKDRHYKNAIANELFLSVAARLAHHAHGKQRARYLDWADREWRWFSQSGMINADGLVNDGLDGACHNNGRTAWSYNQGVVLGGLAALNEVERRPDLLVAASRIANAALTHLTDTNHVLHDVCEPKCGEDGVQFKGIFTRNLAVLQRSVPDERFVRFLESNADSAWSNARTADDRFNTVWSGPPVAGNAAAQTSALDLLASAAAVTTP